MWSVFALRATSVTVVVTALALRRRPMLVERRSRATVAGAGVFDAGANALYVLAIRQGLLSLVSVLSSLYPAATVVLARIVLRERMGRRQLLGIALALGGVALIAAG